MNTEYSEVKNGCKDLVLHSVPDSLLYQEIYKSTFVEKSLVLVEEEAVHKSVISRLSTSLKSPCLCFDI